MRRARIKVAPKLGPSLGSRLVKSELKPDSTPVVTNNIQEHPIEESTSDLSPPENAQSTLTSSESPATHGDPPDLLQSNQGSELATNLPVAVSILADPEPLKTSAAVSVLQEPEQLKTPETEKQTAAKVILRFNKFKPKPNLARPPRKPGLVESPSLSEKVPDPIPISTSVPESSTEILAEPEIPTAPDSIQFSPENQLSNHPEAEPARVEQNKNEDVKAASTSSNASRFRPRIQRIRPNIGEGASHRVRTFSSASESEEDQGRKRVRHSSVSSRTDEHSKRPSKFQEELDDEEDEARITGKNAKKVREKTALQLRKEEVMKKLKAGNLERNKLTMFDLIFYNPSSNPLPKDESQKSIHKESVDAEEIAEEEVSEEIEEVTISEAEVAKEEEDEEEQEDNAPGPRVKVGPNGEIILDEQSLVIETTEAKRNRVEMLSKPVIVETNNGFVNYGTWRKTKRSKTWTIRETARFYRALSMLGTDFSLMESLFPNRTRPELKKKFKIEEKQNRTLIDNTIRNQKQFDPSLFGPDNESDDEENVKETAKKTRKGKENDQKKGKESKKAKKKPKGPSLEREPTSQMQEQAVSDPEPQAVAVSTEFKKPRVRKRPMVIQEDEEVVEECSTQHQISSVIESEAESVPLVGETVEVLTHEAEDECNPPSKMDLMLQSPLGQLSMEIGGVTMPDGSDPDNPSMLLPAHLTEANPALAQALDGSLVLVAADNPDHPGKKIIHVYKVKAGASNAQVEEPTEGSKDQT